MSSVTLGPPSSFRAVKAQGTSKQNYYDLLGWGSDKALLRKEPGNTLNGLCLDDIRIAITRPRLT